MTGDDTSSNASGALYICGTPIGNLSDASDRLRDTLGSVDTILCEDTRRTRQLLTALGVSAPRLEALNGENEERKSEHLISLLEGGLRMAVVSDAGMPVVSDPGGLLISLARAQGIHVEVVPGPCAVSSALARAGVTGTYFFAGFLPRRALDLQKLAVQFEGQCVVGYESPNRVLSTIKALAEVQPNRVVHVVRELTKVYEEVITGSLAELVRGDKLVAVRGEIVLIFAAIQQFSDGQSGPEFGRAVQLAERLHSAGLSLSAAAATAAKHEGVHRSSVYDAVVSSLPQTE